jgi:hypothetical protein
MFVTALVLDMLVNYANMKSTNAHPTRLSILVILGSHVGTLQEVSFVAIVQNPFSVTAGFAST